MQNLTQARQAPHALDYERSILSTILQTPQDHIPQAIAAHLTPAVFYLPAHAILYTVILERYADGQPLELTPIHQHLIETKQLDAVGGASTLVELSNHSPSAAHFDHYLDKVKEQHLLRNTIALCNQATSDAFDYPPDVPAYLDALESSILSLKDTLHHQESHSLKSLVATAFDSLQSLLKGEKTTLGLTTGYPLLDKMTNGLEPGELLILAARPSMGKTSLMMNLVEHIALDQGKPSLVFSCEMTAQQIIQRLLWSRSRLALSDVTDGKKLSRGDLETLKKVGTDIATAPLHIDDTPNIPIGELRAKARRAKREHDIQLLAVDYIQLMRSNSRQANDNREREISEISSGLKALAKELSIPIIALAQLNRGVEHRQGNIPRMSDLRESGSLEQDADMVALLYRTDYYQQPDREGDDDNDPDPEETSEAKLILAKNRGGATGDISLLFHKKLMRFENHYWKN